MKCDTESTIKESHSILSDLLGNVFLILQHLLSCWEIWHSSICKYYTTWIHSFALFYSEIYACPTVKRQISDARQAGKHEHLYAAVDWGTGAARYKVAENLHSTYDV